MSRKTCVSVVFAAACLMACGQAKAQEFVHGHYQHSHYHPGASYVQPHYRSHADGNFYNNWSTYPNVNPFTGLVGTHHYPSYHYHYQPHYASYGYYPSYGYGYNGGYRYGW
ncbi:MAG TPA: hypothetical protein VMV69_27320 [Pirellulales bacterium]|nr:hypothetical protein [Pirellulales bacterium]